ncbi:hypothetical protein M2451_002606 [Dysgonomonas sp. PFB1-18]|uniref:hypothetical protein n=1 Tax=unclassified Dysgonomonas TaxID=2630389 RepID=UPI002473E989|nr:MULTISPECIES: hypothetical protein [unclassified Dysgonomonas]MDH6308087.1 hypothetical protein [Dysgonomonas sp. PF1-14]MDH6339626.1 hypothetical protein [Dysgonomonas sp. PF1-16]MDH6381277.1 hypothetical protein [Dysgonomonas sp. PFB1-18]MDH6398489.1 hypothetical protein [Dysgonomonas sp. PF1-23]
MYNKRTWINKDNSPSTGNVVAFDGEVDWGDGKTRSIFLSVSDCNVSARLHKSHDDTVEDFIDKMKLLRDEINLFINHLEANK